LSKKTELHGALKSAFNKLYGYTSDEDGIRHAILEEKEVGFDEAKYMIVACSAFVNFLISKAAATGLLATAAKSEFSPRPQGNSLNSGPDPVQGLIADVSSLTEMMLSACTT
jgi:hypothetical protein